MHFEHSSYNHGNSGHGYLEYLRHGHHALVVLGYHIGREWSPLLELTIYPPFKEKYESSIPFGRVHKLKLGPVEIHLRLSRSMCELFIGLRRHGVLYG
jgi:hypothetical protein